MFTKYAVFLIIHIEQQQRPIDWAGISILASVFTRVGFFFFFELENKVTHVDLFFPQCFKVRRKRMTKIGT